MSDSGRALAWSLAGFSAGVLCAAAAPSWIGGLAAVGCAVAFLITGRCLNARHRTGAIAALAVLVGFGWCLLNVERQAASRWPAERAGEVAALVGIVEGLPERRGDRTRLTLDLSEPIAGEAGPRRVELSWFRPDGWPRPGETWRFEARLHPPSGLLNPGAFDRGRALFAERIDALGTVLDGTRLAPGGLSSAAARLRQDASDWLQASIVDLRSAALVRAIAVGDRSGIEPGLAEQLRSSGTAHLLAISGLHVGLVATVAALLAGLLFTPSRMRFLWPDRRRYALVGGLLAALTYAMLSGFSLPTRRAMLMLGVGLGAALLRRPIAPGRALLLALAAVLAFDPLAPLALGFWLSFAAVAVLIWAFAGRSRTAGRGALGLVRAQLVLGLGLLPLNLGLFQHWVPAALPANLLVIPLVGVIVLPLALLAVAMFAMGLPIERLARASGTGMEWALAAIDRIGAALPADAIGWTPGPAAIALGFIGALWLLAPRGWPARALGAVLLVPLLTVRPIQPPLGGFDLHVLDIGDGQAAAVRTRSSTLLFGLGPGNGEDSSRLPGTIVPALRSLGAGAVDVVVVPGADRGQAGGLGHARGHWPRARYLGRHPALSETCRAGQGWTADGVQFRVLHPSRALPELGGEDDCVLLVASPAGRVLLTGGVGPDVLDRMRERTGPLDAVLVPRQGHRQIVQSGWWDEASPGFALVSVDRANRWGLPHAEFRDHLERRGSAVVTTAACGATTLEFRPGREPVARFEANRRPRPWRNIDRCGHVQPGRAAPPGLGYDAAFRPGTDRPPFRQ